MQHLTKVICQVNVNFCWLYVLKVLHIIFFESQAISLNYFVLRNFFCHFGMVNCHFVILLK